MEKEQTLLYYIRTGDDNRHPNGFNINRFTK